MSSCWSWDSEGRFSQPGAPAFSAVAVEAKSGKAVSAARVSTAAAVKTKDKVRFIDVVLSYRDLLQPIVATPLKTSHAILS